MLQKLWRALKYKYQSDPLFKVILVFTLGTIGVLLIPYVFKYLLLSLFRYLFA